MIHVKHRQRNYREKSRRSGRGSRFLGSEFADVGWPPAEASFLDVAFNGRWLPGRPPPSGAVVHTIR